MKKMRLGLIVAVLVFSFLAGCAMPVLADGGSGIDPVDVPTLPDFLELLAGPTGWALLGAVLSSLVAKWPWYNAQGDAFKRGFILIVTMVIAIIARLAVTYIPAVFWEQTAAYWYIIGGVVAAWLGSQGWFNLKVKPQREKERIASVLE